MTNFEYYTRHVFPSAINHFKSTFKIWSDLMTDNYADYAVLKDSNPAEECRDWFWYDLNDPEIESKDFLEYLIQIMADIDSGKEKLIPLDKNFFDDLLS